MTRTLYVYGVPWNIELVKAVILHDGREVAGLTDKDAMYIKVNTKVSKAAQRSTLLHEVLHAVHNAHEHDADEERCVRQVECGLTSILYDPRNKWFMRFLLDG